MTKRTEEKELYLASLRGDAKTRACTKKGKPCGGRCIPAHWNCRLKGEGETAPTRGNLATLPTELKNKIAARRRGESLSKFTKLALAAGGAAAAGAALNRKGVSPAEVAKNAASAAGLVSAFNPAVAGPATLAALAAGAGAGISSNLKKASKFESRVSGVAAAAVRVRKNIARRRTELAADRTAWNKLQDQIAKSTDQKQTRRWVAESAVRLKSIGANEAKIKALSESVPGRERVVLRARSRSRITLGNIVRATTKGVNESTSSARSISSQMRKNRRSLGLTSLNSPGAKPQFPNWQSNPRNTTDSRTDKKGSKCGGSYISSSKRCTKGSQGNSTRALAKGLAATALIAGGAMALTKITQKRKTSVSKFGLSSYQKRQLSKFRAKGTGKYGARSKRSFTSQQMPYYTEADRPVALKHKRLFRDAEAADAEGKKYSKTVTDPKTGRKRTVKYGAKGYTIAPGTKRGNSYCARSFGDMKSHNKNCAGKDRNTPLCLSRAKWKCSGKTSR